MFIDFFFEYEFEFLELDIVRINKIGLIVGRYFLEDVFFKVYFVFISRGIFVEEILRVLKDGKIFEEEFIKSFMRVVLMVILMFKGIFVINYFKEVIEEILKFFKKFGYIEIKGGKVRKIREMGE